MRKHLLLFALFTLVAAIEPARADDEKFPVLKVGSETYSNVTVTTVTATDIYFLHSRGAANAKLKDLDPEMQRHFHFNGASAASSAPQTAAAPKAARPGLGPHPTDAAGLKAEIDQAMAYVRWIVNQPVQSYHQTPEMAVAVYHEGWFHPGAQTPDFNNVDIRNHQELNYGKFDWVTSDLNPGIVFRGSDLEFNSKTKFFYTDRTVPKKKLTAEEMIEVNRLYRVIGRDQQDLDKLNSSWFHF